MGKSRSATLITAYLLSVSSTDPTPHTPDTALALIRQCRPFAEPNPGFMDQLMLYHRMSCPRDLDVHPQYQRWCYTRAVDDAASRGEAPDFAAAGGLRFRDELVEAAAGAAPESLDGDDRGKKEAMSYRCRRCRQRLVTSAYLLEHTPNPPTTSKSFTRNAPPPPSSSSSSTSSSRQQQQQGPCAHLFLDQPLSWMRAELDQGKLEGRLECPNSRCRTQVGRYAWQGLKCSCGGWECPGICLGMSKVDGVRDRGAKGEGGGGGGGSGAGDGGDLGCGDDKEPREKI